MPAIKFSQLSTLNTLQSGTIIPVVYNGTNYKLTVDLLKGYVTPVWSEVRNKPTFAEIAFSGDYAVLVNKPAIPTKVSQLEIDVDLGDTAVWSSIIGKPTFATVATSGSYADLINKPNLAVYVTATGLTSILSSYTTQTYVTSQGYITTSSLTWNNITGKPAFATVSTSGSYTHLTNTPVLATVATSGRYGDLSDKPLNLSNFNNDIGVGSGGVSTATVTTLIANSLTNNLATVARTGNWTDVVNKPAWFSTTATGYLYSDGTGTLGFQSVQGGGGSSPTDRITTGSYSLILGADGVLTMPGSITSLDGQSVVMYASTGSAAIVSNYSGVNQLFVQDDGAYVQTSEVVTTNHTIGSNGSQFYTDVDIGNGFGVIDGWRQRNQQQIEINIFTAQAPIWSILIGASLGAVVIVTYSTLSGNQTFTSVLSQQFTGAGQYDPGHDYGQRYSGRIDGTLPVGQTGIVSINFPTYTTNYKTWTFSNTGTLTAPGDIVLPYGTIGSGTLDGIKLTTDRGTVLFGNTPECVPTVASHFHIMRDDPTTVDLFFGDDLNYVKLPYDSTLTNVGVQIGTDATNLWSFSKDGVLTLPGGNTRIGNVFGTDGIIGSTGTGVGVGAFGQGGYAALQWIDDPEDATSVAAIVVNSPIASTTGTVQIATGLVAGPTAENVWEFGADGNLTVPDDIQDANGSVIRVASTSTAPTRVDGQLWFNNQEGRLYIKNGGVWLDASPTQIPSPETYLDNIEIDGNNIILPPGGDILDSNGVSVLGDRSIALPSWITVVPGTNHLPTLNVDYGWDSSGAWSTNATILDAEESTSYPFRTTFSIPDDTKSVTTVDFVVADFGVDFGIGVFAAGTNPVWSWSGGPLGGSNQTRIGAQYNGPNPELHGISGGDDNDYDLPGYGTYRARLTVEPTGPGTADITLETLDTSNNVLDTISYTETSFFGTDYKIGFASDQDDVTPRTYFKNLTINVNNGATVYTDTLMNGSSTGGGTTALGDRLTAGSSSVVLGTDGALTLPEGGVISNNYGVIRLKPAGSGSTQALLIYPTGTVDGDHLHLTAGGGDTDLYLGNDDQFVKVDHSGTVVVQTYSTATTSTWTFGTDGIITLPNSLTIDGSGTGGEDVRIGGTSTWISVNNNGAPPGFYIRTDAGVNNHQWVFDVDGSTTFPNDTILGTGEDPNVYIETATTATTSTWTFGTDGILTLPAATPVIRGGGTGTDVVVIASTGTNPAVWTFAADGGLTFPDSTVQTTAYTGGVSSVSTSTLVNGTYTVALSTTGQLNLPGAANTESNNARIQSANSIDVLSNLSLWTFGTDGVLTIPDGGIVGGPVGTNKIDLSWDVSVISGKTIKINPGSGGVVSPTYWSFSSDISGGGILFPAGSSIDDRVSGVLIGGAGETRVNRFYAKVSNTLYETVDADTGITYRLINQAGTWSLDVVGDSNPRYTSSDLITWTGGEAPAPTGELSTRATELSVGTGTTWTFGTDGSTTLPIGVSIDESSGSQFPRIIADPGKAFSLQGQGSTGSAAIAWLDYESTSSQYAAVGVSGTGTDNLAKVVLVAGSSTPTLKVWRFDETGTLTFPNGANIAIPAGVPRTGAIAITSSTELLIGTNTTTTNNLWTFGIDGSTVFPENTVKGYCFTATNAVFNYIAQAGSFYYTDSPILSLISTIGGLWYIKGPGLVGWKPVTAVQDNSGVALIVRIGSGAGPMGDGSEFHSGGHLPTSPDLVYTISQYLDFDLKAADKTWTFSENGSVTFPDSTVQTTAYVPATASASTYTGWFKAAGTVVQLDTLLARINSTGTMQISSTIVETIGQGSAFAWNGVRNKGATMSSFGQGGTNWVNPGDWLDISATPLDNDFEVATVSVFKLGGTGSLYRITYVGATNNKWSVNIERVAQG